MIRQNNAKKWIRWLWIWRCNHEDFHQVGRFPGFVSFETFSLILTMWAHTQKNAYLSHTNNQTKHSNILQNVFDKYVHNYCIQKLCYKKLKLKMLTLIFKAIFAISRIGYNSADQVMLQQQNHISFDKELVIHWR